MKMTIWVIIFVTLGCLFFSTNCKPRTCAGNLPVEECSQIINLLNELHINPTSVKYVLLEGRVKCKGCEQFWMMEFANSKEFLSNTLIIRGEFSPVLIDSPYFNNGVNTTFSVIEKHFPYVANYFLFTIDKGRVECCSELGSANMVHGLRPFL